MARPDHPSDPPLRTTALPTGPFTWTEEGEGPVIVAVHGAPGSVRDWRWVGAALPPTIRFVRLDLPGFGGTPRATAPGAHLDARGRFVADALAALGIDRCVLLGHSMGGPVALAAAAHAPDRVVGLALIASVGLRPHRLIRRLPGHATWAWLMDAPVVGRPAQHALRQLFRLAGFPSGLPLEEVAQTARCLGALDFEAQRRNTAAWRGPTLCAWADDDAFIEPAIPEAHAAALPDGPRLRWAEGGHNVQKTRAIEIADALVAWHPTGS